MKSQNPLGCLVRLARIHLCVSLSVLVSACGETDQLPPGAALSISPGSRIINVENRSDPNGICLVDRSIYVDMPIVLSMVDSNGSPLGHVDVSVYVDFSGNTFPGTPVLELYDDRRGNNNGVIDDFELVSGAGDDIAIVKTDLYGGDRPLLLRMNVSCPYEGDVFAFSDGISATSSLAVVAEEAEEDTEQNSQ